MRKKRLPASRESKSILRHRTFDPVTVRLGRRRAIVLSFDLRRHNLPLWICQRDLAIDINLVRSSVERPGER